LSVHEFINVVLEGHSRAPVPTPNFEDDGLSSDIGLDSNGMFTKCDEGAAANGQTKNTRNANLSEIIPLVNRNNGAEATANMQDAFIRPIKQLKPLVKKDKLVEVTIQ